jgi:benzoylformate decarboxylase/acetolactate synthase-1/2/3 large subunit
MPSAARYGSDVVVDLLAELDIAYVACNPGATFRGLHDSVVNHGQGRVELIECLHEEISVAIAHGFAKAAGRPMAAAVHDVVGLQHASMAIYNAWCDQVAVLVLGATGPMDASVRRPWIDWIHTALVQGTQVRDYTKWDDQPASLAAVPEALVLGTRIADTAPRGPVYVCLDSQLQEQTVSDEFPVPDVASFAVPTPLAPDPHAVEQTARWLVAAEQPVVVADLVGRSQTALDLLVELAELVGIAVVDRERSYNKASLNFPTRHELNLSGDPDLALDGADVVVGLEVRDLTASLGRSARPAYGGRGRGHGPPDSARIVHVEVASLVTASWSTGSPRLHAATLHVQAESAAFLTALLPRVHALAGEVEGFTRRAASRRRRLAEISGRRREAWYDEAASATGDGEIPRSLLALALDEATRDADRVLANGSLDNWVHRLWSLERAEQYLGDSGGAGLGYGLGASCGAALAHRDSDRLVIDIQSDGDALYTPGALWTAAHHRLPLLVVVDDNRGFNNSVEHAERIARQRGRPVANRTEGCVIEAPVIDFAGMARSFGVHAEGPIADPDELVPALSRARHVVEEQRRPALVDVVTGLTPVGSVRGV